MFILTDTPENVINPHDDDLNFERTSGLNFIFNYTWPGNVINHHDDDLNLKEHQDKMLSQLYLSTKCHQSS